MERLKSLFFSSILPLIIILTLAAIIVIFLRDGFLQTYNIELLLLITLIIAEGFMLYKMRREHIERFTLEKSLIETRRALGRENYLSLISEGIEQAEEEVLFTTRSMATPEKEPIMERIIRVSAKKRGGNFRHRGIIAPRHDTIAGAYELINRAAINIRFHDYYNSSTLRFVIIDKKKSILAIAKPEEPSEQAYFIDSYTLAKALAAEFENLWTDDKVMSFPQYVKKAIEALGELPTSEKAKRLNIPEEVIENPEKVGNSSQDNQKLGEAEGIEEG